VAPTATIPTGEALQQPKLMTSFHGVKVRQLRAQRRFTSEQFAKITDAFAFHDRQEAGAIDAKQFRLIMHELGR
jgi:Ca2+-binding EF-hand superfamily protein